MHFTQLGTFQLIHFESPFFCSKVPLVGIQLGKKSIMAHAGVVARNIALVHQWRATHSVPRHSSRAEMIAVPQGVRFQCLLHVLVAQQA